MLIKILFLATITAGLFVLPFLMTSQAPGDAPQAQAAQPPPSGSETLVVAGGCFWCVEAIFEELKGVHSVESGYAGGQVKNPTYEQVCSGTTGHAEAVKIVFDPKQISAEDLLRIFFTTHDPTTLNRQGNDFGTQYRSAIFFSTPDEEKRAKDIIAEVAAARIWPGKIVTTVEPLVNYSRAEDHHQDYFKKYEQGSASQRASMNAGYCSAIIEPKVRKFREKYASKLKKG